MGLKPDFFYRLSWGDYARLTIHNQLQDIKQLRNTRIILSGLIGGSEAKKAIQLPEDYNKMIDFKNPTKKEWAKIKYRLRFVKGFNELN